MIDMKLYINIYSRLFTKNLLFISLPIFLLFLQIKKYFIFSRFLFLLQNDFLFKSSSLHSLDNSLSIFFFISLILFCFSSSFKRGIFCFFISFSISLILGNIPI